MPLSPWTCERPTTASSCDDMTPRGTGRSAWDRGSFGHLQVIHQVVPQSAAQALVEASTQASLMVVGAHHRHGHFGMALGRVNHAVLHYAGCPVAVIPER
jgi:nucleotide-binding universal stress UspA family protein